METHTAGEDIGDLLSRPESIPASGYVLHGVFAPDFREGAYHLAYCRRISSLSGNDRRILLEGEMEVCGIVLTGAGKASGSARIRISPTNRTRALALAKPRGFAFTLLFSPFPEAGVAACSFLAGSLANDLALPQDTVSFVVDPLREYIGNTEND